jgi:hypothetical protein
MSHARAALAALTAALLLAAPASAKTSTPALLPFPSDAYTVKDSSSPTGRHLAFKSAQMPRNK